MSLLTMAPPKCAQIPTSDSMSLSEAAIAAEEPSSSEALASAAACAAWRNGAAPARVMDKANTGNPPSYD